MEYRLFPLSPLDPKGYLAGGFCPAQRRSGRRNGHDRRNVHPRASARGRCKRGQEKQALGRSRGGFTTKIHAVVDALGNPLILYLSGGEVHDIVPASDLLSGFRDCNVLADKGYDSAALISELESRNITAVIPSRRNRKEQRVYDHHLYKERHLVECFFNKIKQCRRIATRYEKLAASYLAFVTIMATIVWLL